MLTPFWFCFAQPPPFQTVYDCCENIEAWLAADEDNVAVLHCKAGKGRTGVMICCWMLFAGMWPDADASYVARLMLFCALTSC